jgi:hypothetical protein
MAVRFYRLAMDAHDPPTLARWRAAAGDAPWTGLRDPEGNELCILAPHTSLVE